jgi:hypothetical protein
MNTKEIIKSSNLNDWEKEILLEVDDLDILVDFDLTREDWLKNFADILFTLKSKWEKR